jgi:hypothetical protein
MLPHAWSPVLGFQGVSSLDYYTIYAWSSGQQPFLGIDSVGIFTRLADPIGQNLMNFALSYNFIYPFADITLEWENTTMPVHFTLEAVDRISYYYPLNFYFRDTFGLLDLNYTFNFTALNQYLRVGLSNQYEVQSIGIYSTNSYNLNNPYTWNYQILNQLGSSVYFKLADYTLFDTYRTFDYLRGFELDGYYTYYTPFGYGGPYFTTGGNLQIYPYYIPFIALFNGAYSTMNVLSPFTQGYTEYLNSQLLSQYYAGGDFGVEIFSADPQWGLPLYLPIYINKISWTAGYRDAYLSDTYLQSVYTRLTLTLPYPMFGFLSRIKLNLFVEVYYGINNNNFGFYIGYNSGREFEEN